MSFGSPDKAIQRKGPMALSNRGLKKASVKIGISKAFSTPNRFACVRILFPLSKTLAPLFWKERIALTSLAIEAPASDSSFFGFD